jgi:hypothetical protein
MAKTRPIAARKSFIGAIRRLPSLFRGARRA